jgi:hypothetical protein
MGANNIFAMFLIVSLQMNKLLIDLHTWLKKDTSGHSDWLACESLQE